MITFREIAEIRKIGCNPYNRIIMEKEKQDFTYKKLCKILSEEFNYTIAEESLKKTLTCGRKLDSYLVNMLNEILGIRGEIDNEEALAIYHYIKHRPKFDGYPTKDKKEKQQEMFDVAHHIKNDPCYINKLLLESMDNAEREDADELERLHKKRREEIEFLKRALLIYRKSPHAFDKPFSTTTLTEQDEEKLKCLEIEIHEQ